MLDPDDNSLFKRLDGKWNIILDKFVTGNSSDTKIKNTIEWRIHWNNSVECTINTKYRWSCL